MKHLKISNSKWAVKHLPALAAAVAVTLALAFTPKTVDPGFAIDPDSDPEEEEEWINLSQWQIGTHYLCEESEEICTYESDDKDSDPLVDEATFVILQRPNE